MNSQKAILVRVGVDHSYGNWNAPADPDSGQFVYVPIPEKQGTRFHPRCERRYRELVPSLDRFTEAMGDGPMSNLSLPSHLLGRSMHLDPDFEYLTYGDVGDRRGSHIRELKEDDLLVFYAGLRPCKACEHKLIYALVGLYVVDEVIHINQVPKYRWKENAHTRKLKRGASDIVVRAKPGVSGRSRAFIPIGEYRNRAYRVRTDLLKAWGGLSVNDGYIQRSARPPRFLEPVRFQRWFEKQNAALIAANNPDAEPDRVVVVHLRRPHKANPKETRADPFWEFGSFGCTGCHSKNLMNPAKINELDGVRLAFAQGGPLGFRLVMLTPPVRVVRHKVRCELRWEPIEMPFRYEAAPLLIDSSGQSDFKSLSRILRLAGRTTWPAQFSSKFRSRRTPLPEDVAMEISRTYQRLRVVAHSNQIAERYEHALPYAPNVIDKTRGETYRQLIRKLQTNGAQGVGRSCSNR